MASLVKFSLVLTALPNRQHPIPTMTTQTAFPSMTHKEQKEYGLGYFSPSFAQKQTGFRSMNNFRRN